MTPSRNTFFAGALVLAWAFCAPAMAEPAATTLPASAIPGQSSAMIPAEAQGERALRVEVAEVQGEVSIQKSGSQEATPLTKGMALRGGDIIKTGQGSCRLMIEGKTRVSMTPQSTLRVSTESLLHLDGGNLMVKLAKLKKGSTFEVTTPTATAVVRGTTLYLMTGSGFAKLYVDETAGGVVWKNLASGKETTIPAFSMSTAFSDGRLEDLLKMTPEQKEAFFKEWQGAAGSSLSQQFGIEEVRTGGPGGIPGVIPDLLQNALALNDALLDKIAEQNILGTSGLFNPETVPPPPPVVTPPFILPNPGRDTQEQSLIRTEIARILNLQDVDSADAQLAQIADAQTGKVFIDALGNRVRTDQYIFHPEGSNFVRFLSLTARTGDYQPGVSSVDFITLFNRNFGNDVQLSALPWNDYMNVVTREDVAANLGIPKTIEGNPNPDYDLLYDQYIVHEHAPELAEGPAALYPINFLAVFGNAAGTPEAPQGSGDQILFTEAYSTPFTLNLQSGDVLAQGKELGITTVAPFSPLNPLVIVIESQFTSDKFISVGGSEPQFFVQDESTSGDGSQTASFASNFTAAKLLDINYYRSLAANSDGNPSNDEHPAYFDEALNERFASDGETVIGRNHLIGAFIPTNDQGQVIDQAGFRIRGLRDIVSPNPQVEGGNYNLNVVLMYGFVEGAGQASDPFKEDFRIHVVLTPEIFQRYPNQVSSPSSLFPPALHADEDDTSAQQNA